MNWKKGSNGKGREGRDRTDRMGWESKDWMGGIG